MTTDDLIGETESFLKSRSDAMLAIRSRECVACYVARMLCEFGCDGTCRWAVHYRDVFAPRATALLDRLGRVGAFCDCEIFRNGYTVVDVLMVRGPDGTWDAPAEPPGCRGVRRGSVRRGSVRPCAAWQRMRRGTW